MRTFIPRGILCNDGDLIPRLEEIEGCLKTRYACSRSRKSVNTGIRKHRKTVQMWINTLRLLHAWLSGRGGAYCNGFVLNYAGCRFKAMSDTKCLGRVVATNEDKYLILTSDQSAYAPGSASSRSPKSSALMLNNFVFQTAISH